MAVARVVVIATRSDREGDVSNARRWVAAIHRARIVIVVALSGDSRMRRRARGRIAGVRGACIVVVDQGWRPRNTVTRSAASFGSVARIAVSATRAEGELGVAHLSRTRLASVGGANLVVINGYAIATVESAGAIQAKFINRTLFVKVADSRAAVRAAAKPRLWVAGQVDAIAIAFAGFEANVVVTASVQAAVGVARARRVGLCRALP